MANYGVLTDTVAISGSLIAAASAIAFAWMDRARWLPPEESVPRATAKVSALICAVIIGILYAERMRIGLALMAWIAVVCLLVVVASLILSIYMNTKYTYFRSNTKRSSEVRMLGGSRLTNEAEGISRTKQLVGQQLFENANFRSELVWTPQSRAYVMIIATLVYILLQAGGSIALAATALVIGLAT